MNRPGTDNFGPKSDVALDSAGSPCDVSDSVGEPSKPKKKRVRRDKRELGFFRREARKLGDELAQLWEIQGQRFLTTFLYEGTTSQKQRELPCVQGCNGYRPIVPRQVVKTSVWQAIAERQSKERGRALARNLELRAQLEAEYKIGKQLVTLLDRQSDAKTLLPEKRWTSVLSGEESFKQQSERAENTLLEINKVLEGPAFRETSYSFIDTFIEKGAFVMRSSMTLPFGVNAVANALWRVLSSDQIKEFCYYHRVRVMNSEDANLTKRADEVGHCVGQVAHKSDTTIAHEFGIQLPDDTVDAAFRGMYTFSRFQDGGKRVIVYVADFEPVKLNGAACAPIQCQTTGWIQLSDTKPLPVSATLAQSYSRLTFEAMHDDPAKTPHLRYFVNLAQPIHDKFMASFSPVLEKVLVEEDWKLNGGWMDEQCNDLHGACF